MPKIKSEATLPRCTCLTAQAMPILEEKAQVQKPEVMLSMARCNFFTFPVSQLCHLEWSWKCLISSSTVVLSGRCRRPGGGPAGKGDHHHLRSFKHLQQRHPFALICQNHVESHQQGDWDEQYSPIHTDGSFCWSLWSGFQLRCCCCRGQSQRSQCRWYLQVKCFYAVKLEIWTLRCALCHGQQWLHPHQCGWGDMQSSRVSSLYSTINNCHDIECLKDKRIFQGPTRQAKHIGKQNLTKAASRYLGMKRLYFSKLYFSKLYFPNCIFPNCIFPNCIFRTRL